MIDVRHEIQRAHRRNTPTEVGAGLAQTLPWTLVEYSPDDYDVNDQALALRFLIASVKRHRRVDGPRGYLDFGQRTGGNPARHPVQGYLRR